MLGTLCPSLRRSVALSLTAAFLVCVRSQNIRFIGALTKFGVVPPNTTFIIMKTLLDDFTPGSVEVVCHLFETCGRYLHRLPSTSQRMTNMVRGGRKATTVRRHERDSPWRCCRRGPRPPARAAHEEEDGVSP